MHQHWPYWCFPSCLTLQSELPQPCTATFLKNSVPSGELWINQHREGGDCPQFRHTLRLAQSGQSLPKNVGPFSRAEFSASHSHVRGLPLRVSPQDPVQRGLLACWKFVFGTIITFQLLVPLWVLYWVGFGSGEGQGSFLVCFLVSFAASWPKSPHIPTNTLHPPTYKIEGESAFPDKRFPGSVALLWTKLVLKIPHLVAARWKWDLWDNLLGRVDIRHQQA